MQLRKLEGNKMDHLGWMGEAHTLALVLFLQADPNPNQTMETHLPNSFLSAHSGERFINSQLSFLGQMHRRLKLSLLFFAA